MSLVTVPQHEAAAPPHRPRSAGPGTQPTADWGSKQLTLHLVLLISNVLAVVSWLERPKEVFSLSLVHFDLKSSWWFRNTSAGAEPKPLRRLDSSS